MLRVAGFVLGLAVGSAANAAPPRLWIEGDVEPAKVPVNAQATFTLRFGHAVDVRSPRLDPPRARLAEVLPLGPEETREVSRDGLRYRVHERRFAILPFASGALELRAAVAGSTPAGLAETGGRQRFVLESPPATLHVEAAAADADWLPARAVRVSSEDRAPVGLRTGDTWVRRLTVEAEGVEGSVIPSPRWTATAAWSVRSDPPELGTRVEQGRVVGYRRQTTHWTALSAGRLELPALAVRWWRPGDRDWSTSGLPALPIDVAPRREANPAEAGALSPRVPGPWPDPILISVLAALVPLALLGVALRGRLFRWKTRRAKRLAVIRACDRNDAQAARQAVLSWALAAGLPAASLGALAAAADGDAALAGALGELEAACYGRTPVRWNGQALRQAFWRRARRSQLPARAMSQRIGASRLGKDSG